MIIHTFDNGWGPEWPLKQLERSILDQYLAPLMQDSQRWVMINSAWYTQNYHESVLDFLRKTTFDGIVLVSMIDAAIPQPTWYKEFNCKIHAVGYYPGPTAVDFWALVVDKFIKLDSYNITSDVTVDTAYMCLNRKPHWHRKKLYHALESRNLLKNGLVSMGTDTGRALQTVPNDQGQSNLAPNPGTEQNGIANDIVTLGNPSNWHRHMLNVVTETVFEVERNYFVSEKIYKPIMGHRPFLVYSPKGATNWLTDRLFESYVQDFKDISDLDLTEPDNIAPFIETLCQQPASYWQSKLVGLQSKILYNKQNFSTYTQSQYKKIAQGIIF